MKSTWIILESDDPTRYIGGKTVDRKTHWFEIELAGDADSPQQIATQVASAFEKEGYKSEPVAFGLDSQHVFASEITLERGNANSLPFELEAISPFAAENITCDSSARIGESLGCWIETNRYRELVASLAGKGIRISTVSSSLLWACQKLVAELPNPPTAVCFERQDNLQLLGFTNGVITSWKRLPFDIATLEREREMSLPQDSKLIFAFDKEQPKSKNANTSQPTKLEIRKVENATSISADTRQLAALFADKALRQKAEPWFEFYRDALITASGRKTADQAVLTLLGTGCLLLFSIVAFALIFANRYDQETSAIKASQSQIFQELFPGERVPVGVRRRLKIRAEQLIATRKEPVELPERGVVLSSLYRFLQSMPIATEENDFRYHVNSIKINRDDVALVGSVCDHGSADVIAQSMSEQGFVVESPKTESLPSRGVSLNLVAAHRATEDETK